jgi:tyrosyl-tRNA synthetase
MSDNKSLLTRRVAKILPSKESLENVMNEKKLRVYIGVDPTATRLHLGHTIGIKKLMEFANAGHEAILLFGTGTVLVGDPSLRDSARKLIKQDEIAENIRTWRDQVAKIIDFDKVTIKHNGDWLTQMNLADLVNVASHISATQLFKRESFTRRIERGDTVWYQETMYPLLQGYDSVVMDVDLEIGGTDQEFNMLMGRELQRKMNDREKFVLETPMILGTDGKQMSKTSGNCIWLDDSPEDMYGKLMTMNDAQIEEYALLVSNMTSDEVDQVVQRLSSEENPRDIKSDVAKSITAEYHSPEAAQQAAELFAAQFQRDELPEDIEEVSLAKEDWDVSEILLETGLVESKSAGRRLLEQGGVKLNKQKVQDSEIRINDGDVLQAGKRRFARLRISK